MSTTSVRGRPGATWQVSAVAAELAVVLAAGTAWFLLHDDGRADGGLRVTTPAKEPFGISLPSTGAGQAYTFGSMSLCVTGTGAQEATVDSVQVVDAKGGLRVDGFATRPLSGSMFGAEPVTLASTGFGSGRAVSGACGGSPGGEELAVQLSKPAVGDARGSGLLVTWHVGDARGTVTIPAHIFPCQGAN